MSDRTVLHGMTGVLQGVRVIEQGTFITGPCAGMMLADLGADVVKIESPEGDPYRSYQGDQYSPHFQAYNRNKRSIAVDLKSPADRSLFEGLVREADVYIQNFRPGTAERLGAGVQRLQDLNPRLVYCSISGFGAARSVTLARRQLTRQTANKPRRKRATRIARSVRRSECCGFVLLRSVTLGFRRRRCADVLGLHSGGGHTRHGQGSYRRHSLGSPPPRCATEICASATCAILWRHGWVTLAARDERLL